MYRYLIAQVRSKENDESIYQHTQEDIQEIDPKININKHLLISLIEALKFLQAEQYDYVRYRYLGREFVNHLKSSWFYTAYTEYSGADIPIYEYLKVILGMSVSKFEHNIISAFNKKILEDVTLSSNLQIRLTSLSKNILSASVYATALFAVYMALCTLESSKSFQFLKLCIVTMISSVLMHGANLFSSVIQYDYSRVRSSLTPADAQVKLRKTSDLFKKIIKTAIIDENTPTLRQ